MQKINQEFKCEICGHLNPPAAQTCRNHCRQCLYSKHLDAHIPGDRAANCGGPMEPIKIDQNPKKGFMILHHCLLCDAEQNNKAAEDDNFDQIILLSQKQIGKSKKTPHFVLRDRKKKAARKFKA